MRINSNDQLDVEGTCLFACDGLGITYNFYLYFLDVGINAWTPFTNVSYFYKSNLSDTGLVISKDLFIDYSNRIYWKVQMTSTLITYSRSNLTGFSSVLFYVNFSPLNGTCDINPKNGSTNDLFNIDCNHWADSDGNVVSFSYFGNIFLLFL